MVKEFVPKTLKQLEDTTIDTPTNNDILAYNNGIVKNLSASELGLALGSDIPTTLAELSDDATHRLVTDTEKSTWNGKKNDSALVDYFPTSEQREIPQETIITNFQSGHGFTLTSGTGSIIDDTNIFSKGSQSLKITTNGAGSQLRVQKTSISPVINLNNKVIKILLRFDDPTTLLTTSGGQVFLAFSSDNFSANYFYSSATYTVAKEYGGNNWIEVEFSPSNYVITGAPNLSSINAVRLYIRDSSAGVFNIWVQSISYYTNPASQGIVSIVFDDGANSQYLEGRKKLSEYGFPATAYVMTENIDTSGYMTLSQLKELHDIHKWDISAHHNTNLTTLSASEIETVMKSTKNFLVSNGLNRGIDHMSYPNGAYNQTVLPIIQKYFKTARLSSAQLHSALPTNTPYRLKAFSMSGSVSPATLATEITNCINNKDWLIIIYHRISATISLPEDHLIADFATEIDNIYASGVRVMTISDVYNNWNGKQDALGFTPENISNKSTTTTLGTSDTLYPTQNAVKTYADNKVSDITYDATTWDAVTTVAPSKNAVRDKIEQIVPITYVPSTMTVNYGTLDIGTVSDLAVVGGTDVNISEVAGANALQVELVFNSVQRFNLFDFYGRYDGGSLHTLEIELYNNGTTSWDSFGRISNNTNKIWYSFPIFNTTQYLNAGQVRVRFRHNQSGNTSHNLILDYTEVSFGSSGGSGTIGASVVTFGASGNLAATNVQAAIEELDSEKVIANGAITGATNTKITYDSKGLVTSGTSATTADITDSTDKRYCTDAQKTVIGNTSGTNSGDNATNTQYSGLATSKADVAQTMYIGTTSVPINRTTGALTLAGITLTTPTLGVATATSINGATITSGTLNGSVTGSNTGDQTISDATITTTDVTTNNATTSKHGFVVKATAPAANQLNVVGLTNGETAYTNKTILGSGTPSTQTYGDTASAGTSLEAAHVDHKHTFPAVPAIDATGAATDITTRNASTSAHGLVVKAVAPASTMINTVGIGNGETIYSMKPLFDATAMSTQAFGDSASNGTSTLTARADHKHGMPANPSDASITTTDVTTNNVSTSKHGFFPKLPTASGLFLRDDLSWQAPGGSGDMVLSGIQSVTGLKTFDKDKIAMKGTSTGVNTVSVANASATSYTNTIPAKDGTFAMTSDITGTNSGTNTGDNAVNSLYSGLVTNATHTGDATGSGALTVVALNGTNLAALGTGVLKNTTSTGVPFISKVTITEPATSSTLTIVNGATLTASATATVSGSNTGDQTISDATTTFTDITTGNASTSTHGYLLKATAPAANELNVVGIANGETVYANKDLFNTTAPAVLGTASSGTSIQASRSDHVHTNPAIDTLAAATDITTRDATTSAHGLALKATAPAATFINTLGIGNGETVYSMKPFFDATVPSTQAFGDAAAAGTSTVTARRDHKHAMMSLPAIDATGAATDITTRNATTSAHGLVVKAVAPAAGLYNYVGITNGETVYSNKPLFDATSPSTQAYGDTAVVGTAATVARIDHKHAMPAAVTTIVGITGTKAQFDTAVTDGNILYVGDVTSNATHTGEVTGSGALTVDKTAISNKTAVTALGEDYLLIGDSSDTNNLKKVLVSDLYKVVRVVHGATGSTARPTAEYVEWVGTATPANAINNDTWIDTN